MVDNDNRDALLEKVSFIERAAPVDRYLLDVVGSPGEDATIRIGEVVGWARADAFETRGA